MLMGENREFNFLNSELTKSVTLPVMDPEDDANTKQVAYLKYVSAWSYAGAQQQRKRRVWVAVI